MSKLLAGRYELIEKIGEGGMAVVYKAKCRLLNRYVAIKILRPEFTKDAQFVENFKKESQAAAGLQHPNIVSVYDVGKEGNIHFIVMELIDGRPLSDIIADEAPFDYKRSIEITKQVASALSLAHKNNIIHRDVKPHNIMITKDGTAKLADFGIAKAVSDSTLVTETSKIIGSVHYFSPEQARGAYVDERSDIYSLGIVLYEMLTGRVPFDGDNPVQVALMHINDDMIPPSKLVPGIPPALEKLVMKATNKFQSNRYRNAEELLEDLENIEFVTKMVGNSVFAASDVEEFQEMNRRKAAAEAEYDDEDIENFAPKKKKTKTSKSASKPAKPAKPKRDVSDEERAAKRRKKLIIGGVAGAVIVILAIVGIVFSSGLFGGLHVPDLVGMEPEAAEKQLEEMGLKMEIGQSVTSDEVEKGQIAAHNPPDGTKVEKGDTITVMLSSGKPTGLVPRLVGMPYDEANVRAILQANNYELGTVTEEESDEDIGTIISQDPGTGTQAENGTRVNIVISKGTDKVAVPKLVGLTLEEAREALAAKGLVIGTPTYEESTVYAKNIIMGAQYAEGEKVAKGTVVNITVSNGVPEVTPPDEGEGGEGEGGNEGNNGNGNGNGSEGENGGEETPSEGE